MLLIAVAMVACTPQPALAGSCTAFHAGQDARMPWMQEHGTATPGMASTGHRLTLPVNDGLKPAATTPAIAYKTSGNSPAHIGAGSSDIKSRSLYSELIVAGVTFAPIPDH